VNHQPLQLDHSFQPNPKRDHSNPSIPLENVTPSTSTLIRLTQSQQKPPSKTPIPSTNKKRTQGTSRFLFFKRCRLVSFRMYVCLGVHSKQYSVFVTKIWRFHHNVSTFCPFHMHGEFGG
jgi:hypothetical protein